MLLFAACHTPPPATETPTWYSDVKPVVDRACMRCHSGESWAPSFADPAYVQALAPVIKQKTGDGTMPPPAPDPACRPYQGSEIMTITDEEVALFAAWADGGAPLGDEADDTSTPTTVTAAPFDRTIMAASPYVPDFADDGNDYRCFGLELGNAEPIYVDTVEAIVGNPRIVHHVVLFTVDDDEELDTSAGGFSCSGLGESGWDYFAGWAPGAVPFQLPAGHAMRLETNARVAMSMHYFGDAETAGEPDQSGFGFKETSQPEHGTIVYPVGPDGFTIPAGEAAKEISLSFKWDASYGTFHVLAVWPHMHLLGRAFSMTSGSRKEPDCLVDSSPWDFHNQVPARFDEEFTIADGDRVTVTCTYDNSDTSPYQYNDPPENVSFGENTTNEMCFAFTYGYLD